jgi:hypothetical protein
VGKPRVLTKTASAPSATADVGADGAVFGFEFGLGGGEFGLGGGEFGFGLSVRIHLKLNERNSGIRYTIYKYKIISLNKMNYNQNFIRECEKLYKEIQENKSIKECLNTAAAAATSTTDTAADIYEPLWFVYYMFFAIHNPKMEEYIQKKSAAAATAAEKERNPVDIIKNMLKRRKYTSTIVYELYTHAYTNEGNVTYIYPKYKNNILIKSFKNNHLKTTAVLLRRQQQQQQHCGETAATPAALSTFLDYVITTQTIVPAVSGRIPLLRKIENINYKRKDLIILALVCYMKVDEYDNKKKNIFIII